MSTCGHVSPTSIHIFRVGDFGWRSVLANIFGICTLRFAKILVSRCQALPFYYAFTGCDTTSHFYGKGKKSSWEAWKSHPSATSISLCIETPISAITPASPIFEILEHFTCVLYDKTTPIFKVNELRKDLF